MSAALLFLLTVALAVVLTACGDGVSAYERANTACGGGPPVRIIQHDGEFANDDWLEVRCRGGSVRAVANG